jgi:hypothetical protein
MKKEARCGDCGEYISECDCEHEPGEIEEIYETKIEDEEDEDGEI